MQRSGVKAGSVPLAVKARGSGRAAVGLRELGVRVVRPERTNATEGSSVPLAVEKDTTVEQEQTLLFL